MDAVTTPGGWDALAEDVDAEPDHGLTDPAVRRAPLPGRGGWSAPCGRRRTSSR